MAEAERSYKVPFAKKLVMGHHSEEQRNFIEIVDRFNLENQPGMVSDLVFPGVLTIHNVRMISGIASYAEHFVVEVYQVIVKS